MAAFLIVLQMMFGSASYSSLTPAQQNAALCQAHQNGIVVIDQSIVQ